MTALAEDLARRVGVKVACEALNVPRSQVYRARQGVSSRPRPTPARALSEEERSALRQTLNSERFAECAPRQVYAALLDEGVYLCSWRTMYRVLEAHDEVRERRDQLRHPSYRKPELLGSAPNQVWSWDITKLRGPVKWTYFYLYVLLDIYSRYAVGWLLADQESAALAEVLVEESCRKQGVIADQLTLHADNGGPMRAKSLALLLSDLGVSESHSRPHTSDDNPFSEAHFKTLKYHPTYPDRFGCLEDARAWARQFFLWYNQEHYHSGLNLLTPASVHYGQATLIQQQRQTVLSAAYAAHPERFSQGAPIVAGPPSAVWINPPSAGNLP
jgi:transposase InsO family protein